MGMIQNRNEPRLPSAPAEYDPEYFNRLNSVIGLFFTQINMIQQLNLAGININIDTLPTEASLATLRSGDVYRDTTASNVLKVKP